MALYGWCLFSGACLARDFGRGQQLVQQSKHIAANVLTLMYRKQIDTGDDTEALRLFMECDMSDPHMQYLLGLCLLHGWGCNVDQAEAMRCFESAGNHVIAVFQHAKAFRYEQGVPRDFARAVQLFEHAAEQGYAWAQSELGMMYYTGRGAASDLEKAKHWMQMAAAQGNRAARKWCNEH
eukprot:TRINITY_DN8556_c0_g1_i1.p1 TRINITY_DN8556_c0_g1~~TRINITY_DN8556_c0_g1_i1.p1  ORF type:complete len:180 (-),score=45.96 TRINITY_DN8556_c0_g1_i1:36-575(-)